MARDFKSGITLDGNAVGQLATSGTASDLGTAARGTSTESAHADHVHSSNIAQATSTPSFSSNSYTITSGDEGRLLLASNSTTAGSVKIPTNATTAFAVGTQIHLVQTGTGQLTISAVTSGTTTVSSALGVAPKMRTQYSGATLIKTGTDTWYVLGDIA